MLFLGGLGSQTSCPFCVSQINSPDFTSLMRTTSSNSKHWLVPELHSLTVEPSASLGFSRNAQPRRRVSWLRSLNVIEIGYLSWTSNSGPSALRSSRRVRPASFHKIRYSPNLCPYHCLLQVFPQVSHWLTLMRPSQNSLSLAPYSILPQIAQQLGEPRACHVKCLAALNPLELDCTHFIATFFVLPDDTGFTA